MADAGMRQLVKSNLYVRLSMKFSSKQPRLALSDNYYADGLVNKLPTIFVEIKIKIIIKKKKKNALHIPRSLLKMLST